MSRYIEFNAAEPALVRQRNIARQLCHQLNLSFEGKSQIASELFGSLGNDFELWGSFFCEFGVNIHIADKVFINTSCVFLDAFEITIASNVFIGPNVSIYTSNHAVEADRRRNFIEYGAPVRIEEDVWIGGNVVLLPGVTIGKGSIIAAGTIINGDIPPHSRAFGPRSTTIQTQRICG